MASLNLVSRLSRRFQATPQSVRPRTTKHLRLEALESRLTPSAGNLDPTFSGDGLASVGFNFPGGLDDSASAVAVQADGKIVVVGTAMTNGSDADFAIVRYNKNGTLDSTFGVGGKRTIAFNLGGGLKDTATCVAIDSLGRILIGGYAELDGSSNSFAVCRLTTAGLLDSTFGTDGKRVVAMQTPWANDGRCNAMALQSDGKIVLAGIAKVQGGEWDMAVARLTSNGEQLDSTFSLDGRQFIAFDLGSGDLDYAHAVAIDSANRIVVGGSAMKTSAEYDMAVFRLTTQGELDVTFGVQGKKTIDFAPVGTKSDGIRAMVIDSQQRIILVGETRINAQASSEFAICRLSTNGQLDLTFDQDGKQTIRFNSGWTNIASSVALQADGKILVAGWVYTSSTNADFAIGRLHSDGAIDLTFTGDGKRTIAFDLGDENRDHANGIAVTPEGIVVVGTVSTASNGKDFAVARLKHDDWVIVSADQGGPPTVKIFSPSGTLLQQFDAYGASFTGGVRTATGDINGDGLAEIFCAPGPGGLPIVKIYDGKTLGLLGQVQVYGLSFTLGVNLAVGDVMGDGKLELVVAPDVGGAPYVNIFDPLTGLMVKQMLVYGQSYTGGVRVALGNAYVAKNEVFSKKEVLVAPQQGGAPVVNIFEAATATLIKQIQAFGNSFTGGLYIACGKVNNSGYDDLIVGAGPGGAPTVNIFETENATLIEQHPAFGAGFNLGVRVGCIDIDGNGKMDVLAGAGAGGGPTVKVVNSDTGAEVSVFDAFEAAMTAGLFVSTATR